MLTRLSLAICDSSE